MDINIDDLLETASTTEVASTPTEEVGAAVEENFVDLLSNKNMEKLSHAFRSSKPCDWNISEIEGGIRATNISNGGIFEGPIKEFSALLRG